LPSELGRQHARRCVARQPDGPPRRFLPRPRAAARRGRP
jgi:hypothetical protein